MDLEDRGRADLGHRFLNAYLEQTGDYAGLQVLPFYLAYRALVRAKITALRAEQQDVDVDERRGLEAEHRAYLEQASRYAKPIRPFIAIAHGFSGSGKTHGTEPLVERIGAIRIRSDVERKRLFALRPTDRPTTDQISRFYGPDANEQTYRRLNELTEQIILAGLPVVVDASFLHSADRAAFADLSGRLDVPFLILDFQTPEAMLHDRLLRRKSQNTDASDADLEVLKSQQETAEPLSGPEQKLTVEVVPETKPEQVVAWVQAVFVPTV
jgi:predicted kinase